MNRKNPKASMSRKMRAVSFLMTLVMLLATLSTVMVFNASASGVSSAYPAYMPITPADTGIRGGSNKINGTWNAGSNTVYYLSDLALADYNAQNGTNITEVEAVTGNGNNKRYSGTRFLCSFKTTSGSNHVGINNTYKNQAKLMLGNGVTYDKGLGLHPAAANTEGYAIFDLNSAFGNYTNCDTFYALVGMSKNDSSTTVGCYYSVSGSTDNATWTELVKTGVLVKDAVGEINVNISGYRYIKISTTAAGNHSSCSSVFANACIYKADSNAIAPVQNFAYLSDLTPVKLKINNNANLGVDSPYGSSYVGKKVGFTHHNSHYNKMIGVHAANIAASGAYDAFGQYMMENFGIKATTGAPYAGCYLVYDISAFDYDTFYTRMVKTNTAGTGGTLHVFGSNSFVPTAYTTENAVNTAKNTGSDVWTKIETTPSTLAGTETVDVYANIAGYDYIAIFLQDGDGTVSGDATAFLNTMIYNDDPVFVGTQERLNATDSTKMDVRFIGSITTLDHDAVGLKIERVSDGKVYDIPSVASVYSSITATIGGESVEVKASELGGNYVFTVTMKNVPAEGEVSFKVTPYAVVDGTPVYGAESTVTFTNGPKA